MTRGAPSCVDGLLHRFSVWRLNRASERRSLIWCPITASVVLIIWGLSSLACLGEGAHLIKPGGLVVGTSSELVTCGVTTFHLVLLLLLLELAFLHWGTQRSWPLVKRERIGDLKDWLRTVRGLVIVSAIFYFEVCLYLKGPLFWRFSPILSFISA